MCGNHEVYENKYCKNSCDCKQNEYHNENYYQSWNEVHLCVLCPALPVQTLRPSVLNALLRETKDWRYLPATAADELSQIHIRLANPAIRVSVHYFSPTQHHQYRFPATLIQTDSDRSDAVTFPQLLDLILENLL